MNSYERYLYNQKSTEELKKLIERMLENESKSSSEGTQEREKTPSQVTEAGRKDFDQINIEEVLNVLDK